MFCRMVRPGSLIFSDYREFLWVKGWEHILARKKAVIARKWFDLASRTYAPDTANFLKNKKDPFANPVGAAMRNGIEVLLDQLLTTMDPETITTYLDPIIRIRAVQNFTPSRATAFILLLKTVVRDILAKELDDSSIHTDLLVFESKIDRLCLMAFDIYMQCREKVYQISANETRNRTFRAFERAGLIVEPLE